MDRTTFSATIRAFKERKPYRPFTMVTVSGSRHEVDFPDALVERAGVAVSLGPAGVPTIFDYEGVSDVIGDLPGRSAQA